MRVYFTTPWIPPEWIRAHGLEPRGFWLNGHSPNNAQPLSAGVCAFAEKAVRFAETLPNSPVVFTTSCDQMRRGFDCATLHHSSGAFLFNIPATHSPAARQLYRSELVRLGQFLKEWGGQTPTQDILRDEMAQAGQLRQRLLESAPQCQASDFARAVATFHGNNVFTIPKLAALNDAVPLAIIGGPFVEPHWPLSDVLEKAGGRVVLNATETGERSLPPPLPCSPAENPFDVLADGWFDHIIDAFQRPNTKLYFWLKPRLKTRGVRGILLWHYTNCDLWRAEAQSLREAFGLPLLLLESGLEPGIAARDVSRLQAFVEMLK